MQKNHTTCANRRPGRITRREAVRLLRHRAFRGGSQRRACATAAGDLPCILPGAGDQASRHRLRLRVLKIAGWVRERAERWGPRLCLHLSSYHPGEPLWRVLDPRPKRPVNNPG